MTYALITGASRGIGSALSIELSKKRVNLILVSRNYEKLITNTSILEKEYGNECIPIRCDLSDPGAPFNLFNQLKALNVIPSILINNACSYVRGPFMETDFRKESEIIVSQCMNIPALTKLFIQQQEFQNEAYILNVASTGSFVPGPFNAIYCAAKSFILSFSEALSEELEENGINVSVLCPGGTNTSFQENYDTTSGFFNPLMEPDQVAKIAIRDMFRKKRIIIPGAMNKVQTFLPRILPRKLLTTMSAKLTRPPMSKRGIVLK